MAIPQQADHSCVFFLADESSQEWVKAVDRGGLQHVSDEIFMLFVSMELQLRRQLSEQQLSEADIKRAAIAAIISDEEVLFYWSMVAYNWEDDVSDILLEMIVNNWVTVRGFSFTSAFMEKYKQETKLSLQKSKGLRKTLVPKTQGNSSTSEDA